MRHECNVASTSRGVRTALEAGRGEVPPEPSEGTRPCQHPNFRALPPLLSHHAAQLAIVKQMSLQGSRSSDGNCHADEPSGITQLSRP